MYSILTCAFRHSLSLKTYDVNDVDVCAGLKERLHHGNMTSNCSFSKCDASTLFARRGDREREEDYC